MMLTQLYTEVVLVYDMRQIVSSADLATDMVAWLAFFGLTRAVDDAGQ